MSDLYERLDAARLERENQMNELAKKHGLVGHPKLSRAYTLAWEYGHSSGLNEVASYFDDLAELMKP